MIARISEQDAQNALLTIALVRKELMRYFVFTVFAALFLSACANPSITSVDKVAVSAYSSSPIYVPRFEGKPDFVEESTDMFVASLRQKTSRRIIQGDALRNESTDIMGGGNIAPKETGLSAAKSAGAGILVLGKVTSHKTETMLNGFVTIRIFDVQSGNMIGTIHRPSGLLIAYSEHQCVMTAAKRTGKALASEM